MENTEILKEIKKTLESIDDHLQALVLLKLKKAGKEYFEGGRPFKEVYDCFFKKYLLTMDGSIYPDADRYKVD